MMLQNRIHSADIVPSKPKSLVRPGSHSSMRFCVAALVFVAAAAMALSACGDSGSTNPPASRPSTTAVSTSTPSSRPSVALPSTTPTTEAPVTTPTTEAPTTTPTTEAPTTTVPPTTTPTTEAPTTTTPTTEAPTTTVPPTTTPTTEAPTTSLVSPTSIPNTESVPTTIATAAPSSSSTSSTPWGWIVLGILLAGGVVVALVLVLRSRSRRAAWTAWRQSAEPALQQALVARDLLGGDEAYVEPERREAVRAQVEAAAQAVDELARSGPDDAARSAASSSAAALRGLMFALEADRLLRSREESPTAEELVQTDAVRRARVQDLDDALEELTNQTRPEVGTESPPAGLR